MRLVYEHLTDIPLNFTEVEYLETTNQQNNASSTNDVAYIDTGVTPDATTKFECRVQFTPLISGNSNEALFGTTGISSSEPARMAFGFASISPYTNFYMGLGTQNLTTSITRDTAVHIFTIDASNSSWKIDDTTGTFTNTGVVVGGGPIYLFARNYAAYEYANKPANAKLYYCKIWKNNVLIRDFVPCLDNNNVPCMYDKVNGKAYYNLGNGSFTYGRKIIPVEYLESSGTQYIDTGIKGKSGISAKTKVNYTYLSGSASHAIGGEYTSNTSCYFGMVRANGHFTYLYKTSVVETTTTLSTNTDYDIDITLNNGNQRFVINGNVVSTGTVSGDFTSTNNLFLYAINSVNGADVYGSLKMYYMKISDNGTLIRDYIPCKDENNVGFLFDRATHTAYLNAGTGSFTFGKTLPKKKLRLIMDSKRRLPKGFTEVEYLQSSGTEWIDIGTNVNTAIDEIEMYFQLTDTANYKWIFGEHDDNARLGLGTGDGTNKRNVAYYNATSKVNDTEMYNSQHYYKVSSSGVYLNGTKIANYASFSSTSTLYLFNLNLSSATYMCKGKVWAYRHKRNGVLIRDMIPCLDTNNVPCMYDVVNNKAYYNQGTGTFTVGRQVIPVEYLESTGEQYIDTGVIYNDNTGLDVGFSFTPQTITSAKHLIGGQTNDTRYNPLYCTVVDGSNKIRTLLNIAGSANITRDFDTDYHTLQFNTYSNKRVVYDGVVEGTVESIGTGNSVNLFRRNFPTGYAYCNGRLYYVKLHNGSNIVRDFIPCKDENNVGYMFDTLSHTLYANAGTGSFVVGDEYKDITRFLKGA